MAFVGGSTGHLFVSTGGAATDISPATPKDVWMTAGAVVFQGGASGKLFVHRAGRTDELSAGPDLVVPGSL